jgi:hypothetical protein
MHSELCADCLHSHKFSPGSPIEEPCLDTDCKCVVYNVPSVIEPLESARHATKGVAYLKYEQRKAVT